MSKIINFLSGKPGYLDFIKGYLSVYIDKGLYGYITLDKCNHGDEIVKIIFPDYFIDKIIKEDDVFGVLVGGDFLYCNMYICLNKVYLLYENDRVCIKSVDEIIFLDGNLEKKIEFQ
ncbi:hypothetical protein [Dickeya ananatis]|uniref:hypothetical protein n=1 Tax=Dickeya ananatis TaxID=3061286 RepID=UPI00388D95E0